MEFWYYFDYIINAVLQLLNTKIVIGGLSFTFMAVFIGSAVLGLVFYAVGRLLR